MRNVRRAETPEPASLKRNKKRWTEELLAKIEGNRGQPSAVPERYYSRYNKDDVKAALNSMYGNLCCYCEARVGIVDYPHIEHRKPKRGPNAFPELTYEWENLHLGCTKCNVHKGDQYNTEHPILDACLDAPITDHLTYQIYGDGVWRKPKNLRGKTTVVHADLNRPELVEARRKVLTTALNLIGELNINPEDPAASVTKNQLDALCKEDLGSVISYAKETYLKQ